MEREKEKDKDKERKMETTKYGINCSSERGNLHVDSELKSFGSFCPSSPSQFLTKTEQATEYDVATKKSFSPLVVIPVLVLVVAVVVVIVTQ